MIKNFVDDLKRARDNKSYLSALALALTLPDICGKQEYYGTSNMEIKDMYIKWIDKWIYKYIEIPKSENQEFNNYEELLKFDGNVCYALRCEFLHSGNKLDYYNQNGIRIDRFELCVSDTEWQLGECHGCQISNGQIVETHRRFNVSNILYSFILGTEDYISQKGDSSKVFGNIKIEKI